MRTSTFPPPVREHVYLDDLERFLGSAPLLSRSDNPSHGAHMSYLGILEGGVGVLLKPEDALAEGPAMVRREVAAWLLARELGWPDLVAATVLRQIDSPTSPGSWVHASVQVLWPDNSPGMPISSFPAEDITRAAVFDVLVKQSDRAGGNWLGVPSDPSATRLKLIDHGYAFDVSRGWGSAFITHCSGDALGEVDASRPTRPLACDHARARVRDRSRGRAGRFVVGATRKADRLRWRSISALRPALRPE